MRFEGQEGPIEEEATEDEQSDKTKQDFGADVRDLNQPKSDTPAQETTLGSIVRWNTARKMCRRVNSAAIKTASDVYVKFVPRTRFEVVLGGETAIRDFFKTLKQPITPAIQHRLQAILVVLCLMGRPTKIKLFVESGVFDTDLPLVECPCLTGANGAKILQSRRTTSGPYVHFKKPADAEDFLRKQWSVLAWEFPNFDGIVHHTDLEDGMILPYLTQKHVSRPGGFGDVYRVEIHPDHYSSKVCHQTSFTQTYPNCGLRTERRQCFRRQNPETTADSSRGFQAREQGARETSSHKSLA